MAEGINIKVLPRATNIQNDDFILIDKNVVGTQIIPFSAIIVNDSQVTFYTDFVDLSAYTYALSANTNIVFAKFGTNIDSISSNVLNLSSQFQFLDTSLNNLSTNTIQIETDLIDLSSNFNLLKNDTNILSSNLINLQTNTNNISSDVELLSSNFLGLQSNFLNLSSDFDFISDNTCTFISGGTSPSGSIVPDFVGVFYFAEDTKDYFVSIDNITNKDWRRILTVDY